MTSPSGIWEARCNISLAMNYDFALRIWEARCNISLAMNYDFAIRNMRSKVQYLTGYELWLRPQDMRSKVQYLTGNELWLRPQEYEKQRAISHWQWTMTSPSGIWEARCKFKAAGSTIDTEIADREKRFVACSSHKDYIQRLVKMK